MQKIEVLMPRKQESEGARTEQDQIRQMNESQQSFRSKISHASHINTSNKNGKLTLFTGRTMEPRSPVIKSGGSPLKKARVQSHDS